MTAPFPAKPWLGKGSAKAELSINRLKWRIDQEGATWGNMERVIHRQTERERGPAPLKQGEIPLRYRVIAEVII